MTALRDSISCYTKWFFGKSNFSRSFQKVTSDYSSKLFAPDFYDNHQESITNSCYHLIHFATWSPQARGSQYSKQVYGISIQKSFKSVLHTLPLFTSRLISPHRTSRKHSMINRWGVKTEQTTWLMCLESR